MLEVLGPASGPYNGYVETKTDVAQNAARKASLFDVFRLYRRHADAAIDLGSALVLAAAMGELDRDLYAVVEPALRAFLAASTVRDGNPDDEDARDGLVGAALELADQVYDQLGERRR